MSTDGWHDAGSSFGPAQPSLVAAEGQVGRPLSSPAILPAGAPPFAAGRDSDRYLTRTRFGAGTGVLRHHRGIPGVIRNSCPCSRRRPGPPPIEAPPGLAAANLSDLRERPGGDVAAHPLRPTRPEECGRNRRRLSQPYERARSGRPPLAAGRTGRESAEPFPRPAPGRWARADAPATGVPRRC